MERSRVIITMPKTTKIHTFCLRLTEKQMLFVKEYAEKCTEIEKAESGKSISMSKVIQHSIDRLMNDYEVTRK